MSDDVQGTATSQDPENQKSSPIKRALLATEGKFAFVKGLTFIGFFGHADRRLFSIFDRL
jgi:hypothetical protein